MTLKAVLTIVVTVALGISAVFAGYEVLDRYGLRPMFKAGHDRDVGNLAADVYSDQLRRARSNFYNIDRERSKYEDAKLPLPIRLLQNWHSAKDELEALERKLRRVKRKR